MRNRSTNAERKLLTFFFKKEGHIRNYAFKSNLIKFTSLLLFLCLSVFTSKAQTTLINPTGDGGFENGSTFSSNGWTVVNYGTGTNNDWFLGNAPVTFAGTNVAYVSNTSGATWNYSNATTSTSHFYRDITVPAGENVLSLNFQWKGNGESGWDRLLIYAAPITVVPATGTPASSSTVFTGATLLYTQTVFPQAAYTNASVNFINGFGSTFRLIFTWQNDASLGTTPPVAIDNISLVSSVPANYTATAQGGLWSSPATWVGGVVPPTGNNVIIPAGSIVTVDQVISVGNIDINGILQWNATATNTLTAFGNITIGSTGRFLPYTTAGAGVALNVGGDFINNGYANLAVHNTTTATGCLLTFNGSIQGSSLAQTLGGTGYFEGNGLRGIIRGLFFTTTGNSTISTTQNLITYSMGHTAGSLNTNGKLVIDNTSLFYGQPINTQVSSVHVTAMGTALTVAPVVCGVAVTPYSSGLAATVGTRYYNGNNVYLCTAVGTFNATPPTSTTLNSTFTTSGPTLLYIGTLGTLGTNVPYNGTLSTTTPYFYGDNWYQAIATTATTIMPTHTSGVANGFVYLGPAAKVSVNYDATSQTVRSLNITNAGSGWSNGTAPTLVFSQGVGGAGTLPTGSAVVLYSPSPWTASQFQKSGVATITGGLTINSDQGASNLSTDPQASSGVGSVYLTNGGLNYSTPPSVGFAGPTALNLVTNPGSGYAVAPIITVSGGTLISGTALATGNFTITMNQGKVVSVYLNAATTACYSVPPTLTFSAGNATLAWPTGCWPSAIANVGSNGQVTSFTMTNPGYGYVAAPTVGLSGGTPTTGAAGITSRVALYNLILNYFTPATTSVVQNDDAVIPANRKLNALQLNGNGNGLNLNNNLTLFGTAPLALVASASVPGNVIDLNGKNLLFTWNGYAGATSTAGASNTFIKNGSMTLTGRGGGTTGSTFNYPFLGNATTGGVTIATGTGTGAANGADILTVKVTETSAPSNTVTGGTGAAVGSRAYKVETGTTGGTAGTAGTNPTFKMPLAASVDNLPAALTQNLAFVSEGASLAGAWNVRSASYGATAIALPANGQLTTATAAPGPITLTSGSHYAWSARVPTVTNIDNLLLCANSGAFTLTGTNFDGATAVAIGGVPVSSFSVVSSTSITGFAGATATGVVTVTGIGGGVGSGSQTVTVNPSPVAPVASPTSQTVLFGNQASLGVTGAGGTLNWYNQPNGGTSLATGTTYSPTPCATTTYYVSENNGSCEGNRVAIPVTVTMPTVSNSTPSFCGIGGNDTLTANNLSTGASFTWTPLTSGATLSSTSSNPTVASLVTTSDFQLAVTVAGCPTYSVYTSIGVYPLPSANLTATPDQICPGGSTLINTGLSSGNFSVISIPPVTFTAPANAGVIMNAGIAVTPLSGGNMDDGGWANIPIGFSFNFFGSSFTTIAAGTNGLLMFGTVPGYGVTAGQLGQYTFNGPPYFPNATNPGNIISLLAGDLHMGNSINGSIKYWTEGYAPNRKFVIKYDRVHGYLSNPEATVTCVLYETLGIVEIFIDNKTFANSAIVGLQDATTTIGAVAPGRTGLWTTTTPEGWRFSPPSNYNTIWTATNINGSTTIANGQNIFTQTVTPSVSTNYSISYTNQTTGCTNAPGSAQIQMNVLSTNPPAGLTSNSTKTLVCINESFDLSTSYTGLPTGLTFQWQASTDGGLTWNNVPSAATPSVTTSESVTTQYRCEITSCGGAAGYSSPILVSIQAPPSVTATASTPVYCAPNGAPVNLSVTGTGTTYAWSPAAGLSTQTGTSVVATPSATTIYTITATDAIGCTNTTTISVTKAESVSISAASATPNVLCSGNNSVLLASATVASETYCQPSTSCTFPDIISNVTFSTISNNTACNGATTNGFTLFSAPNPTVTAGTSLPISVTTSGDIEGAAVWFDFNNNGIFETTELVLNGFAGTNPATYTGTVNIPVTAVNGTIRMRVRCTYNADPNTIGPCANATFGETEDYLVTITGGAEPLTYAWSPATFLNTSTGSSVTAASMSSGQSYTVTATSAAGCSAVDTVDVTVNQTPANPVASNTVICSGNSTTLSTNGANTTSWYDAATGGNYLGNGNSFATPVLNSSISYFVQDSSAQGCISNRTQVDVTVNPTPVVNLGADTTRCGGSVTLDAQNAGATYSWSNGQSAQTITVSASGTYDVLVTNSFNCIDQDTINVTINAIPVVNLGSDSSYCANSFTLDAQNPGFNYLWNTSQNSQTITITTSGSYNVVVTSLQNCSGSDTINLTLTPSPVVNLGADTSLCGGNLILDAQNTGSTFVWNDNTTSSIQFVTASGTFWVDVTNPQNCTSRDSIVIAINTPPTANLGINQSICTGDSVVLDPGATTGATYTWNNNSTNQTLTATATGTYYVNVVTGPNCSASDTVLVTVNALPIVSLNLATTSACASATSVSLSGESPAGGTFSGVGVNGNNFDATASTSNAEVISYSFTDANGCSASATDTINLVAGPSVSLNLGVDSACVNDGPVTLTGESPAGGVFSGTSVTGNVFDPTIGPGTYQIAYTVTDAVTGCSSTATQNFLVDICTDINAGLLNALQVYPNPNKGSFFIDNFSIEGKVIAEMYTIQGKLIKREQLNANTRNLMNVHELSNGIYMLRLIYDNQTRNVKITVAQ